MKTTILLATAFLAFSAHGSDDALKEISISGGYEIQTVGVTVPQSNDPDAPNHVSDSSRSGPRIAFTFKGIRTEYFLDKQQAGGTLTFLPIFVSMDATGWNEGGFGRVSGLEGHSDLVRRMVGALVEGSYDPETGLAEFRGKLARVEYDRDKGIWDWRVLDVEVAAKQAWILVDGTSTIDLEVSLGANIGGLHMNNLAELERALEIAGASSNAFTVNPHAMFKAGFNHKNLRVELVTAGEKRLDLTPGKRPEYLGQRITATSERISTILSAEYVLVKKSEKSPGQWSVFANAGYEYDNLTLSNVFFRTGDAFHSFILMAGLRGRY